MSWTETDPGYRGPKERPLQRNEAAERLLGELHKHYARDRARVLAEALAAERRATVERLDKVLAALVLPIGNDVAYTRGWDAAVDEARRLLAILDEEAARSSEGLRE